MALLFVTSEEIKQLTQSYKIFMRSNPPKSRKERIAARKLLSKLGCKDITFNTNRSIQKTPQPRIGIKRLV